LKELNLRTKPGAKPKGTKTPVKNFAPKEKEKGSKTRQTRKRKK
jgi:hypothetical protein